MSITWNGVSSDTIGVIVERIPNRYVPTRRFSPQQVAGRNGNILLVDKSFPNVEQEYEVYLSAEAQGLPSVARACAEWLMGPDGYCRLEDSYDTTVYREAFLMGGYDLENILNKFGRCTITFSCKPQKYLLTGDTPIEIPAGITTYTGDVVQFDGVTGASITSLSTTITPTQDLHGYSSPWPAGGGVNQWDEDWEVGGISSSNGQNVAQNNIRSKGYIPVSAGAEYYVFVTTDTNKKAYIFYYDSNKGYVGNSGAYVRGVLTIPSGTAFIRFQCNVNYGFAGYGNDIAINYPATVTTYSPYSNICPISGRTGLDVYRTGVNVWDEQYYVSSNRIQSNYIPVLPNTTYNRVSPNNIIPLYYDADKNQLSTGTWGTGVFTTPADCYYLRFQVDGAYGVTYNHDISINYPSTDHDYHAYNGTTYSLDWTSEAGTVYGGTLDVVTGVLTVTHKHLLLNDTDWTWKTGNFGGGKRYYTQETVQDARNTQSCLTSIYPMVDSITNKVGIAIDTAISAKQIDVRTSSGIGFDTLSDFKAYIHDNPIDAVYELATPLTYQLTPTQVELLIGQNNVWTSSGPVSVTVEAPFVGIVTNPTPFEARPMLKVSGVGEITINGKTIQILESVSDFDIDCESMEAEDNSKIYCMDFPYLEGGENEIAGDGSITALTVTPRWWTL